MKRTAPLLALSPHEQKYDDLAQWLGVNLLQMLVPFSQEKVDYALTNRDECLNTLPLVCWDRKHIPVFRLVRTAIHRDTAMGKGNKVAGWSLANSVCVLKHVARFYPREEG